MNTCCAPIQRRENGDAATEPAAQPATPARRAPSFTPVGDVIETNDAYEIALEIPGTTAERIDIRFERGLLTITAEVPSRYPTRDEQPSAVAVRREFAVGDYARRFRIAGDVDADAIEAGYSLGVLTVRVPKADAVRERRIAVSAG